MANRDIPERFRQLQAEGYIRDSDIEKTQDGFFAVCKSLSDILAVKGIFDFPDSDGVRLSCGNFFDDWFLYAVPDGQEAYTYSLLKFREQEHDMADGNADGDTPGVTISFISFECQILWDCLEDPSDENRYRLNKEINRTAAYGGQRHHKALKRYFKNPGSEGAYLAAVLYTKRIASFAENGWIAVPDHYAVIVRNREQRKYSAKAARLMGFIDTLNREAGCTVCDNEKIYIRDPEHPDAYERAAILAVHAGNVSLYSFAAEVEYHARFLIPFIKYAVPLLGRRIYSSAIRADMTIGDTEFEGPAPFYRPDSRIVRRQYRLHKDAYENIP